MSIVWTDGELAEAAALLSSERLAEFLRIAGTERDAVEIHQLCLSVAGALTPVVGLLEIALRNAICRELREAFGVPDWLTNPPPPFAWKGDEKEKLKQGSAHARRAVYTKMTGAEKRALDALAFPSGPPRSRVTLPRPRPPSPRTLPPSPLPRSATSSLCSRALRARALGRSRTTSPRAALPTPPARLGRSNSP